MPYWDRPAGGVLLTYGPARRGRGTTTGRHNVAVRGPIDRAQLARAKWRNRINSWLIMGGLTALLAACAWALFGPGGIIWAIVLGLGLLLLERGLLLERSRQRRGIGGERLLRREHLQELLVGEVELRDVRPTPERSELGRGGRAHQPAPAQPPEPRPAAQVDPRPRRAPRQAQDAPGAPHEPEPAA